MKAIPTFALAALLLVANAPVSLAEPDAYLPGPDSKPQPGVPVGELIKFDFSQSKVFPGTTRHVTVYVPRQYDPAKPACVYVDQDGVQFNAPVVLDNLIARGELPVIIGVFATPGVVNALNPAAALSRYNRSFEYDGLGDAYARLILDEVLPAVEAKVTADGRPIHLSHSGNDRAIAGSSSGAIAAFNAAWEHPEAFSRVISAIGTYIGLRGADRFPTLIRKYEPKPIRVFLQDGSADLNIYAGDWWMANQTMERALTFSGYEVNHAWGDGHHSGNQITSVLPDALRWVWKDWPNAVGNGPTQNGALKAILLPDEGWKVAASGYSAGPPSVNSKGEVFIDEIPRGRHFRITDDGTMTEAEAASPNYFGFHCFGPDGRHYNSTISQIIAEGAEGKSSVVADGIFARQLVVAHNGNLYATDPIGTPETGSLGTVWIIRQDGTKQAVDTGINFPTGIALSPDQSLLYVAEGLSHWIYSFQVKPDGTLDNKQRYYWLHSADASDNSGAEGMCCDQAGWLYVATELGIQVCDQAGRVNAILPPPAGRVSGLCFGGQHFDTLYASCGKTVYARKLHATGSNAWSEPTLPPAPKL
jgi:gluconolactonase